MSQTLDDGLDQAIKTMSECGYIVTAFRSNGDGHPGIVISGENIYTTEIETFLDTEATDDWLTIVRTLESGIEA